MPNSAASLVVFAALAAPGLVFYLVRDSRRPSRDKSALRETAGFVVVGLVCDILALLVFGAVRISWPKDTPDVGELIRRGSLYGQEHYAYVAEWSVLILVVAVVFAVILGALDNFPGTRWPIGPIIDESQWRTVFRTALLPGTLPYARAWLEDGTQLAGIVEWYSADTDETQDRDLVLVEPILLRYAGATEDVPYPISSAVISARRIMHLSVTYMPDSNASGVERRSRTRALLRRLWPQRGLAPNDGNRESP